MTLEHCLNHQAGMHDDDGEFKFDYESFREAVKRNATEYAEKLLSRRKGTPGTFGYSNLGWQLLAFRFEEITGMSPAVVLTRIIGSVGWTWETDASGHCLGPHGLEMTVNAAVRLGSAARMYYPEEVFKISTPSWFWRFNNDPALGRRYVYHGWFCHKSPVFIMYALGFMLQYIVVTKNDVHVQLRGSKQSDFEQEPSQQHLEFFEKIAKKEILSSFHSRS